MGYQQQREWINPQQRDKQNMADRVMEKCG